MAARRPPTATTGAVLHVAEPPAAYLRRAPLVADATVLAAVVFGEEQQALAVALLQSRALAAPQLADYEIVNVGLKKLRRGLLQAQDVSDALADYMTLDLERHGIDLPAVLALAQQYQLTAYDAAYLWLAERLEAPLATFDGRLAQAARQHLAGGAAPQ
jgi:predicted nucleic acid-binding protein